MNDTSGGPFDMLDMGYDDPPVILDQDFDRGMVPMKCDQRENGCSYVLHHYHCQICDKQVNSDELRRDYHPCCSVECIRVYNQQNYPSVS